MNFSFLPQFWSYFNYGVLVTIMISVCVVFFGTILGVLVSLAKRSGIKPLEWLVSLYVWVFRGTPMVVQIMIAFNLIHMNLPTVQFGILNLDLSRIVPGIIVLSLNSGAYISESVRAFLLLESSAAFAVISFYRQGEIYGLKAHARHEKIGRAHV